MSIHNVCFCGEIKNYQKFLDEKSTLSGAMYNLFLLLKYCDSHENYPREAYGTNQWERP